VRNGPYAGEVRLLVQEVTDDKSFPKQECKRLQVEHAPNLSTRAKLIKLIEKQEGRRAKQGHRFQRSRFQNAVATTDK
jgi:hypothetical protein